MESKKYNKLVNLRKDRSKVRNIEDKLEGSREEQCRGLDVLTIMYKISYKDILYNTGSVASIL